MNDLPIFLCALAAVMLIAVGALASVLPERLSRSYGVPVAQPPALAYVRATGARDLTIGAVFAANVYLHDALVLFVLAIAGIALSLADFVIAFTFARGFRSEQFAHAAGVAGFAVIAALLWPHAAR